MAYPRVNRLAEEIKKIISHMIRNDLRDPRIAKMTSIIEVNVTRDLRFATIYISVLGDQQEKEETIEGLKKSSGFIRKEVGRQITARFTPELIFKLDESIERGVYMYDVISKVTQKDMDEKKNSDEKRDSDEKLED
nr:30S ribosome-binding factor RbfA [Alkaliphilus metalliredigens]